MATPTRKLKYEEVCWSLSHSSLAVHCVGVSAFCFSIVSVLGLIAISTTHCTVHHTSANVGMSLNGMPVWARAMYPYHVKGTDMVGRSVDARVPIDHTSVGLAQARPNNT